LNLFSFHQLNPLEGPWQCSLCVTHGCSSGGRGGSISIPGLRQEDAALAADPAAGTPVWPGAVVPPSVCPAWWVAPWGQSPPRASRGAWYPRMRPLRPAALPCSSPTYHRPHRPSEAGVCPCPLKPPSSVGEPLGAGCGEPGAPAPPPRDGAETGRL